MRRKRSNIFKKTKDKDTLNIDPLAEHIRIPFASFVDNKMIKEKRRNHIINNTIDQQILKAQKQYEIKKNSVIDQFKHRVMKRNSQVDINARSLNHSTMSTQDYEGTLFGKMRSNSMSSTSRLNN